jgi:quercetin dioxygenase-like cupin family protein
MYHLALCLSAGIKPLIQHRKERKSAMDTEQADVIEWLGVTYKTILSPDQSRGAMTILDSTAPVTTRPARHIHEREDETVIVLTGQCEFWVEGARLVKGPGETIFVPRGSEHTFRVLGDQPSRHLIVLTPGGFEGFFADMARGHCRIPEDVPEIEASARVHHMKITGPPLGAE